MIINKKIKTKRSYIQYIFLAFFCFYLAILHTRVVDLEKQIKYYILGIEDNDETDEDYFPDEYPPTGIPPGLAGF